jgi:ABC-type nickel/cobalt efflux system permease component RcnA
LALAHPVPPENHDRTIVVHLARDAVTVHYRLEVNTWTAVFKDLEPFKNQRELAGPIAPDEGYEVFTRCYAPVLADNLLATWDMAPLFRRKEQIGGLLAPSSLGPVPRLPFLYFKPARAKDLKFTCVQRQYRLQDNQLVCDFVFRAAWAPRPGEPQQVTFRESNYHLETGWVKLSLESDPSVIVLHQTVPDEALKQRPAAELTDADDDRLREAGATFVVRQATAGTPFPAPEAEAQLSDSNSLLALLLDSRRGLCVLLFLAAGFGAVHALTPGHGKTLVAAYLVGEHGTVWHALVLGLVTTLTHTGAVLALAAGLLLLFPTAVPAHVQMLLGAGGGLLVAGLGFWLLLRRLSGGADHFHLGGHGHHHHDHGHAHADHDHDEHGHAHPLPARERRVGWWGLVVLGMSGGIVPCWDAIAMFGFAVSAHRLWLALPLLVAFSAGLAAVLILIGIGVVYAKGFASSRWGESRFFQVLPVVSAALVTVLGLWLCYESVHPGA